LGLFKAMNLHNVLTLAASGGGASVSGDGDGTGTATACAVGARSASSHAAVTAGSSDAPSDSAGYNDSMVAGVGNAVFALLRVFSAQNTGKLTDKPLKHHTSIAYDRIYTEMVHDVM